ncbi:putative surface protein with fasciclin (FAS1) repeats [Pedobacter sp. UYP30]|uniref:fasciclin domain-containing protein n=1 Tax=Pedobacter sp. UYP30 TaxID=1756400 RepID=UPI0033994315
MKNLKTYLGMFSAVLLVLALYSGCKKDGGYYEAVAKDATFNGTTYEYLKSKPGIFDSLIKVIDRMDLKATLNDSDVTLFAVTNPSFQLALNNLNRLRKQSDKDALFLANIDGVQLDTMTSYYIVKGKITTDSLALQDGRFLTGVRQNYPMHASVTRRSASGQVTAGPEVINFDNTKRSKFTRNWATATTASNNIKTQNGIVHVLNSDHIFGFDEFVKRLTFVPPPPNLMRTIGGKLTVLHESNGGATNGEGSLKVIDGDDHTKFLADLQGRLWMQFELNTPAVSNIYTLTSANDAPERDPRAWTYEGSNDGSTWTELDRVSNFFFEERYQQKVFLCKNTKPFKFYRIDITELRNSGTFQLAEWSINSPK